jgi:hypothetical protein
MPLVAIDCYLGPLRLNANEDDGQYQPLKTLKVRALTTTWFFISRPNKKAGDSICYAAVLYEEAGASPLLDRPDRGLQTYCLTDT